MGHGSHHPADAIYSAMMYKAQKRDPNCFVGTVEGSPTFEEILDQLKARGVKKAYLIPWTYLPKRGSETVLPKTQRTQSPRRPGKPRRRSRP